MNDESDIPVDPRIRELVEYAGSARELVLGAEYLVSEWVTGHIRRYPETFPLEQRAGMRLERKFLALMDEYGVFREAGEYGEREVFGFFRDLYGLRASAAVLSDEQLLDRLVDVYRRHGGEDARQECAESYDRLGLMRQVVTGYLAYAEGWLGGAGDWDGDLMIEDDGIDMEDPGWDAREGGSCNFVMGD